MKQVNIILVVSEPYLLNPFNKKRLFLSSYGFMHNPEYWKGEEFFKKNMEAFFDK